MLYFFALIYSVFVFLVLFIAIYNMTPSTRERLQSQDQVSLFNYEQFLGSNTQQSQVSFDPLQMMMDFGLNPLKETFLS